MWRSECADPHADDESSLFATALKVGGDLLRRLRPSVICAATAELCAQLGVEEDAIYLWVDYHSVSRRVESPHRTIGRVL